MIDIERPLQRAWARTNARLFSTFDFKRWLSLGFVAWLAAFLTGGGGSLNLPWWGNSSGSQANPQEWLGSLDPGPVILLVCSGLLVVGLILIAMMWIGSRAQFMFLDNVLRDRDEVRAPWREFGARGHRFFVFYTWAASIPVVLALLVVFAALLVFWPELISFTWPGWPRVMPWLAVLLVLSLLSLVWSVAMLLYRDFGVPILYASDCTAGEAFSQVWAIARAKPGDCALYLLVRIGLALVFGLLANAVVLLTCCVGGLPYLYSVLTLPLAVFRQSFVLDCLAQLEPEYTLWRDTPPPLEGGA
jgi:hypothetical protein